MRELLKIKDLNVQTIDDDKKILKGLNLTINEGETHVIMGLNGSGKSTLANVIMSSPKYKVTKGSIYFNKENITDLKTNEIAKKGIFMSFQTPEEIPGISLAHFLKSAKNSISSEKINLYAFSNELEKNMDDLNIDKEYIKRDFNVGFSGGEKKKNEILQMITLDPKLAILDEIDSGLDIDAIKIVSKGINMFKKDNNSILIITHSTKIIEKLKVDKVHILVDGKIIKTGTKDLAYEVEKNGYGNYIK